METPAMAMSSFRISAALYLHHVMATAGPCDRGLTDEVWEGALDMIESYVRCLREAFAQLASSELCKEDLLCATGE
jgi:hypothetical protein